MVIEFNRPSSAGAASSGRNTAAQSSERATAGSSTTNTNSSQANSFGASINTETDNVQISPEAQQLQQVTEQIRQLPDADQGRIAKLKQAIADGSYQINSSRIAARMTAFESSLDQDS